MMIFMLTVIVLFKTADVVFPLPSFAPYSQAIYGTDSVLLHLSLSADDKWRLRSRPGDLNASMARVVLFREDRWFWIHPGVNPVAVVRAVWQNTRHGNRVSGASTITMQVARMLERRPRTYSSKLAELFRALQLEWHYSKREILNLWLDHIPYGGNIEGIRAASLFYYGCEPGVLSQAQLAALLVIPNNPNALRPDRHPDRLRKERNRWLMRMHTGGLITRRVLDDALSEPLTMQRRPAPDGIPHLARWLRKRYPRQEEIYTFIDSEKQKKCMQVAVDAARLLQYKGISNLAVMVMNNATGAVEAYVGSVDFHAVAASGQVDGLQAIRSPGSTLKPFLYTLAFDLGHITPLMTINDVATSFGGYSPENYDEKFNGRVTISEALARSLNLPAVKILEQTGLDPFIRFMEKAGFRTIERNKHKLGLSMILGGCGVTAIELTGGYSAFARGGVALIPRFTTTSPFTTDTLFSEEASWMTSRILSLPTRPDLPVMYENSTNLPPVAWKTGTSYGRRDGWAVGFNSHYTITVWTGNFDGRGAIGLSGTDVATPVLFRLFQTLDSRPVRDWLRIPGNLSFRQVCSESGFLPGDSCHHLVTDACITGVSPTNRCEHLKAVWTNKAGTVSFCAECIPESGAVRRWYPNLTPDLLAWYSENKIAYKPIPPHNPRCERVLGTGAPVIVSPADQAEYFIASSDSTPLMLRCQTEGDVTSVHWYLNHRLLKTTGRSEPLFFKPPSGTLRIGCADDKGRSSFITISIQYY